MGPWELLPAGDRAVLLRFNGAPGPAASAEVRRLQAALERRGIPGVEETVPGFTTILVYYNPLALPYERLSAEISACAAPMLDAPEAPGRLLSVPVVYGGEAGPDLERVAAITGLSPDEVVAAHTGQEFTVYFLGFTPGFAYMGDLPARLAVPRLERPRVAVPAGSVGLAGRQTGIYPSENPGGWLIIGRTPWVVYDPHREPRALFRPGDRVRFRAVAGGGG